MNGPLSPVRSRAARLGYRILGLGAVALAALGVALPGLPTTPFLLVALWAFTRGAPGWADRLRRHPRFGGALLAWESRRVIPRPAKTAAVLGATGSFAVFSATANSFAASAGLGLVLTAVLAFVLTRPSA